MQGHFLNLYAMALADLTLDPEELKLLFDFGKRRGIHRDQIEDLLLNPHRIDASVPTDVLNRVRCLYEFAQMIWSDGRVDPAEKALLERFCLAFEFEDDNVTEIVDYLLREAEQGTNVEDVLAAVRQTLGIEE